MVTKKSDSKEPKIAAPRGGRLGNYDPKTDKTVAADGWTKLADGRVLPQNYFDEQGTIIPRRRRRVIDRLIIKEQGQ